MPQPESRRTRLSPEREAEIFTATLDLIREVGYEAARLDTVAQRSHCSKATLYRRWQGKPRLASEALRHGKPFTLSGIDTGSLRGDLYEMTSRIGRARKDHALMRGIALAVRQDSALAEAMHETLVRPDLEAARGIVDRAIARGEVDPANPALDFFPHLIQGAGFARLVFEQREPDADYLRRYVDAVALPVLLRGTDGSATDTT
ncbi:TetR/AcrR family transcriptional regulator [Streptomyces sp. SID10853]|uniref:TetR/AcrR family transcriptional regulator n=1 Tax=Streptomyces sp. SID10853 TaxID=2706028 RepID=UPI0013C086FF|nr:TetR/AcrR family transcriptional regulator [Streptomyces sp. SID10853]NDZ81251.1 TetR/AcrR family transcriptional regulator [Streptomyces sp. SID10853]